MTNANKLDPPDPPSNATAELPPDDRPLSDTESPLVTALRGQIERLKAQLARQQEPDAEQFELLKNAAVDSNVPRQTLSRWADAIPPLVEHYRDEHGNLWIDVKDAIRQRFALAPAPGHAIALKKRRGKRGLG